MQRKVNVRGLRKGKNCYHLRAVIHDFELFALEEDSEKIHLGSYAGLEWWLYVKANYINEENWLQVRLSFRDPKIATVDLKCKIFVYDFNPQKHAAYVCNISDDLQRGKLLGTNKFMPVSTLLDPNKVFLHNGRLPIYVDFEVDALVGRDGVRRFNLYEPTDNCVKITSASWPRVFYVKESLLRFHCLNHQGKSEVRMNPKIKLAACEAFFQVLLGVKIKITDDILTGFLKCVNFWNAPSVLRHHEVCRNWAGAGKTLTPRHCHMHCHKHMHCLPFLVDTLGIPLRMFHFCVRTMRAWITSLFGKRFSWESISRV